MFTSREVIEDVLSTEFMRHLGPHDEPTSEGLVVDELLGAFLARFPTAR